MDDVLDAPLRDFGMTGVFYCHSDLAAPWGIALPAIEGTVMFHLLTQGAAQVEVDGEVTPMATGDVVLVPHGTGHVIRADAESPAAPLFDLPREELTDRYERLRIDGGGTPARLLCGAVFFRDLAVSRLMASLPPVLVAGPGRDREWLAATLQLMADEARAPRPGSVAVTTRLADVLVVQVVRDWLETADPDHGWLAAVRDPHVGRSLRAFHAEPGRPWTLAALAAEAGLSRSGFVARCTGLLGEPPMHYLTGWRMDLAHRLVREGDLTLARIADRVGYRSEAAFNRAFRRAHGCTPGEVRRSGRPS